MQYYDAVKSLVVASYFIWSLNDFSASKTIIHHNCEFISVHCRKKSGELKLTDHYIGELETIASWSLKSYYMIINL